MNFSNTTNTTLSFSYESYQPVLILNIFALIGSTFIISNIIFLQCKSDKRLQFNPHRYFLFLFGIYSFILAFGSIFFPLGPHVNNSDFCRWNSFHLYYFNESIWFISVAISINLILIINAFCVKFDAAKRKKVIIAMTIILTVLSLCIPFILIILTMIWAPEFKSNGTWCSVQALLYTFVFAFCWVFGSIRIIITLANPKFVNKPLEYIHLIFSIAQPFWIALVFIPSEGLISEWGCYELCKKCKREKKPKKDSELKEPLMTSHDGEKSIKIPNETRNHDDEEEGSEYDRMMDVSTIGNNSTNTEDKVLEEQLDK